MTKNQKGFTFLEVFLAILLIGSVSLIGWYVYKVNTSKPKEETSTVELKQNKTSAGVELTAKYSIDLSGSRKPNQKILPYKELELSNAGGGVAVYDEASKKFIKASWDLDENGKSIISKSDAETLSVYSTSTDGTPIYVFHFGDADSYKDYYLIDLKDGNVMYIEFSYCNYDDGMWRCDDYMTLEEIEVQRAKDLEAVKTFKFG